MRTKGEWTTDNRRHGYIRSNRKICGAVGGLAIAKVCDVVGREESISNLEFIAMCGTTAAQLDEAGYDGEKAIELLPEILEFAIGTSNQHCDDHCAEIGDDGIECIHRKAQKLIKELKLSTPTH